MSPSSSIEYVPSAESRSFVAKKRVDDGLAPPSVAARAAIEIEDHVGGLVAVDGVRVDLVGGLAVLGREVLVELLPGGRKLLRGHGRRGQEASRAWTSGGDLLGEVHGRDAVGAEQLGVRHRRVEVLVQLRGVVVDDAAGEDGVSARAP